MDAIDRLLHLGRLILGMGIIIGCCSLAHAQRNNTVIPGYPESIDSYDAREVAMLPTFCRYTQGFRDSVPGGLNDEMIRRYRALLGDAFHHLHHYCWGLMETNRATILSRNTAGSQAYLNSAIGNFDYVIKRAPRDFLLLPEIINKKGENLVRLGRGPVGLLAFEEAATLKPDYWPPYANMSDYYKQAGDVQKAREVLEQGLSLAPDTPALQRRLAELSR